MWLEQSARTDARGWSIHLPLFSWSYKSQTAEFRKSVIPKGEGSPYKDTGAENQTSAR
jgi:hypothetical protein